jgi:hypothetical protein
METYTPSPHSETAETVFDLSTTEGRRERKAWLRAKNRAEWRDEGRRRAKDALRARMRVLELEKQAGEVERVKQERVREGIRGKVRGQSALHLTRNHVACIPALVTCAQLGITLQQYRECIRAHPERIAALNRTADILALTAPLALGIANHQGRASRHAQTVPTYEGDDAGAPARPMREDEQAAAWLARLAKVDGLDM